MDVNKIIKDLEGLSYQQLRELRDAVDAAIGDMEADFAGYREVD